jgi:hypothetical protein
VDARAHARGLGQLEAQHGRAAAWIGRKGGLLIQGADQNYRQIPFGLKTVTGKPVQTTVEDAKYMNP